MTAGPYRLVLTGASGGMGRAFALTLAPHTTALVLTDRDHAQLEQLRQEIANLYPMVAIRLVAGDITDRALQHQLVDAAQALPEPVNLLINAAGVNDFQDFELQAVAMIERLIAVDLLAPIQLTQALLPLLKAADRAQVVNVGSVFGYIGYPGFAAYCAAKFGLRGFSQALRRELSDTNVTVRYFAPRATRTAQNSQAVVALNRELGIKEDTSESVARTLLEFLSSNRTERTLGFPERLYVALNQWLPRINDKAIRGQLAIIRKHLSGGQSALHDRKRGNI